MITFKNYNITFDPIIDEEEVPAALAPLIEEMFYKIKKKPNKKTIEKLHQLIKQYPSNVQLRNFLVNSYNILEQRDKAEEVNNLLLEMRPDYLFARLKKIEFLIEEGENLDKVAEILGDTDFDLRKIYPEREFFHIAEFTAIQQIAIRYYVWAGEAKKAIERIEWLGDIHPDEEVYDSAQALFLRLMLEKDMKKITEIHEKSITPKQNIKREKFKRPDFNFKETEELYQSGWDLSSDFVDAYLQLDRLALIVDLEHVLKDSYCNFDPSNESTHQAAFHAFFILGALESESSLPILFSVLSQDNEYFEPVFGAYLTEMCWQTLYQVGENKISDLFTFLRQAGLYTYGRTVVSNALPMLYIHFPEKQEEIRKGYAQLLQLFLDSELQDNIIDSDFLGIMIVDLIELRLTELLPQIKELFEKAYISTLYVANYQDVEDIMLDQEEITIQNYEIVNLNELYQGMRDAKENKQQTDYNFWEDEMNQQAANFKAGRNDPCPCGSGKKFKKCCIDKSIYN